MQLVKRMESPKATSKHIKQVAGGPHAVQINLMRHQHIELHQENTRRKSHSSSKDKQVTKILVMKINKHQVITRRVLILIMSIRTRLDAQSVEIQPTWKAFSALQRNFNVKLVTSLDILLVFAIKRTSSIQV